jgi:hypothetical protein
MHRQRGVTMIGWIFLLVPVALVAYAGIRVGPEYYSFYKLSAAMKDTAKKLEANDALSPATIRGSLERTFDTGYVDAIDIKEIDIAKVEGGWDITADYESTVPMFGNLYLLMDFNTTAKINSSGGG